MVFLLHYFDASRNSMSSLGTKGRLLDGMAALGPYMETLPILKCSRSIFFKQTHFFFLQETPLSQNVISFLCVCKKIFISIFITYISFLLCTMSGETPITAGARSSFFVCKCRLMLTPHYSTPDTWFMIHDGWDSKWGQNWACGVWSEGLLANCSHFLPKEWLECAQRGMKGCLGIRGEGIQLK